MRLTFLLIIAKAGEGRVREFSAWKLSCCGRKVIQKAVIIDTRLFHGRLSQVIPYQVDADKSAIFWGEIQKCFPTMLKIVYFFQLINFEFEQLRLGPTLLS